MRQNWIKWDLDSRLGEKMCVYFSETGGPGYGFFLCLVEDLYRVSGHKLQNGPLFIQRYTKVYKYTEAQIDLYLTLLCNLGLVCKDTDHLWSERVLFECSDLEQAKQRVSDSRSKAVSARWDKGKPPDTKRYKRIQSDTNVTNVIQSDTNVTRLDKIRSEEIRSDQIIDNPPPPSKGELIVSPTKNRLPKTIDLVFPPCLDNEEARKSLSEWLAYKTERRETYKSNNSVQKLIDRFALLGSTEFVNAVNNSISNNWAGLFSASNGARSTGYPINTAAHTAALNMEFLKKYERKDENGKTDFSPLFGPNEHDKKTPSDVGSDVRSLVFSVIAAKQR